MRKRNKNGGRDRKIKTNRKKSKLLLPSPVYFLKSISKHKHKLPKIFPALYGNQTSVPRSQELAIRPYPKPDESTPRSHPVPLSSILILFSHLRANLLKWSISLRFAPFRTSHVPKWTSLSTGLSSFFIIGGPGFKSQHGDRTLRFNSD
jgi:hypothetical protein